MTSLGSWAWDGVKTVIKFAEPYQTRVATGMILAKLCWRRYKQTPLTRELREINDRIQRLQVILGGETSIDPERIHLKLDELRAMRKEKERQLSYTYMTFGQIPSLFFDHPGSNLYQSVHQLAVRGVQMHHEAHPVHRVAPTFATRLKTAVSFLAGVVSLAGTAASLARMSGAVAKDNPTSHFLSMSAIAVHAFEGTLVVVATMKSVYKWAKEYFGKSAADQERENLPSLQKCRYAL